jgi:quinol monooxygenase YgiN
MGIRTRLFTLQHLHKSLLISLTIYLLTIMSISSASAQEHTPYIRIARIIVDPAQLESYKTALKEGMESAVRIEKGVLTLYAVYDKDNPTHVTVFEIYADENAYKSHTQTPHFKKYKNTVEKMVKSLELTDAVPIALETKPK